MRDTRVIGLRALAVLLGIALAAVLPSLAQEHSQPFLIQGKVVEPSGGPVPGAAVFLDSDNGDTANATTNRTGNFELRVSGGKKHVLRVLAQGFRAEVIELPPYNAGNIQLTVSLKIAPTGAPEVQDSGIQFSDSPNFTVAGVTDWSNVGLHGSDVNVKTSETLTKEAAALKPAAKTSGVANKDAEAHRLLADEKEKNGDPVAADAALTKHNTFVGRVELKNPASSIVAPTLGNWKFADSLPEIQANFSDASWTIANHITTNIPYKPYYGDRVLYGCDYKLYVHRVTICVL